MRRRLIKVVVSAWAAWIVLANLFLQPSIGPRLIAWSPERFDISWSKAWSLVPGLAHVRGLRCGGHSRNTRWRLEIDRARVPVDVPALLLRTFHGVRPRVWGVRATVERTDDFMEPRRRTRPGFRVLLHGVRATEIGHLELAGVAVDGVREVSGTLDTRARGRLRIPGAHARIVDGRIAAGEAILAEQLTAEVAVDVAPFVPREHREKGPLPFISGRVDLTGRLGDLAVLRGFLRKTPMLAFEGGRATVAGVLALDRGRVVEPTDLTVSEAAYGVRYLDDVVATGEGRILVGRATGAEGEVLRFELATFELARPDAPAPYARGEELTLRVHADRIDLVEAGDRVAIAVDIPSAEVLDVGAFDPFLSQRSGVRLVAGRGRLASHIELDLRSGAGSATFELAADDVAARVGEHDLTGRLTVRGTLTARDARERTFDIDDLAIDLAEVAVAGERRHRSSGTTGGWWGRIRVDEGWLRLAKPVEADARVAVAAMDARPILALVEDRSAGARWADRLLDTEDLSGEARLVAAGRGIELRGLELAAGRVTLSAEMCVHGKASTMLVLAGLGGHHVGLERSPDDSAWKLRRPTEWFEAQRPGFRCAGAGGEADRPGG